MTDYYSGLFASTVDQQFLFFVKALLFGFALAALYDILRIYRAAVKCSKTVLLIQDVIYSVIAALLTFLFALVLNNGKVRIYLIISHLLGAILYRLSLSKIIMGISVIIINFIKKIFDFIKRKLFKPIIDYFKNKYKLLSEKIKKSIKNNLKRKKHNKKAEKIKKQKKININISDISR